MPATYSYKLATRFTAPLQIGASLFRPGVTYTEKSFVMSPAIANAIANGILAFADSTSLVEHQSNPVVAKLAADDSKASGVNAQGATATTPKLKLAASLTSPLAVGAMVFKPGVIYQDAAINLTDPALLSAMARGLVVFADSNVAATVFGNPVVYNQVKDAHATQGWFGSHNAFGA